ncbi:Little elongation complex subunit 2 [Portunus trituberculatus]|uniref:Little elongation complex subunit 2 n=1 Tax=Portunus trituberculatus TaxID=210409 RepID=A0A5B7DCG2_PORTR|nr:Little elongation complex subunit 2 [Portunus trituberculatus]
MDEERIVRKVYLWNESGSQWRKRAQHVDDNIQKDEPFVSEESLQQYCSLFAVDGVPSNIREDPYLAEIIKFSDEDLDNIAQGTLPLIMIPHKLGSYTLKIDETVSERECRAQRMVQDRNVLNDTPVSADRNAEYLAQQHRANIVISTSALKVLADNHGPNFDKEWDIPVEVKSYMIKDPDGNQTQHRVVYIDKPMPKKIWTPLEKKQLFFKKASLSHFTKIMRNKMFRMAAPAVFRYSETNINDYDATSRTVAEYDDPFLDLTDATDNDVFGSESLEKRKKETYSKKRKANNKTVNKSPVSAKLSRLETDKLPVPEGKIQEDGNPKVNSQDDTEQETFDESNSKHFLDSLLSLQNSLLKPSHTPAGNETEAQKDKTSKPNRSQPRPWTNKLTTNWMNAFEGSEMASLVQ